jgi:hypothetical protein
LSLNPRSIKWLGFSAQAVWTEPLKQLDFDPKQVVYDANTQYYWIPATSPLALIWILKGIPVETHQKRLI